MKRTKPTTDAPAQPIKLPKFDAPKDVPLVDRSGPSPSLTDAGCDVVRAMAAELFTQEEIAGTLGLSGKQFKTLLGKADADPMSPARAAWENGHAANKGELLRIALHAARRGAMVQTLFLLKAEHGLRDQGPAVQIDAGPRIQFTLPGSMTEEEYFRTLGITAPLDTRPPELRGASPWTTLGLEPPAPTITNTPSLTKGESNAEPSET